VSVSDAWFVYIARCSDGSLYTGVARDVAARLAVHDSGRGAKYTRGRGPLALCAKAKCKTQGDALRLELAVKALPREEKLALASGPRRLSIFARAVSSSKKGSGAAS
jgi:putative endonuclease